jgi:hypothetical protein
VRRERRAAGAEGGGVTPQVREAVERAASRIISDLGITGPLTCHEAGRIAERFSGVPLIVRFPESIKGVMEGDFHTGTSIFVNKSVPDVQKPAVVLHELAHALLFSERYEDLNGPHLAGVPHRWFHEWVARAVERRYLEAGGVGPRTVGEVQD